MCSICHVIEHKDKSCVGTKQVWRPKQTIAKDVATGMPTVKVY